MFKQFYPDRFYDSAYDIAYDELYRQGYRGIIFDVDNTLVEHGAPVNDKAETLFKELHNQGFKTCIISNNSEVLADFMINSCFVELLTEDVIRILDNSHFFRSDFSDDSDTESRARERLAVDDEIGKS